MIAGASSGIAIRLAIPARAAYSAHAAPAFPFVGIATPLTPSSAARETPTAAPRALNVPVGTRPSSFISRSLSPCLRPYARIGSSGVMPSPRLTTCSSEPTGSTSWYRQSVGGLVAMSAGVTASRTRSRSYLASSGAPAAEVPCRTPASYRSPVREHSRWLRNE